MEALVVDDSQAMRIIICGHLKKLGFSRFREAANGKEALNVLAEPGCPELAVVDWNMPVMNGLDLVGELRKRHRYDAMHILVVTSEVEATQVFRAIRAGANEYLMKPFAADALQQKLRLMGALPAPQGTAP